MKPTVILDAGHGIETQGKRSPIWSDGLQLVEWEFNRDIEKHREERLFGQRPRQCRWWYVLGVHYSRFLWTPKTI